MKEFEEARVKLQEHISRVKALADMLDEFDRGGETFEWGWTVMVDEVKSMYDEFLKADI